MAAIAGIVDVCGNGALPPSVLERMAHALHHRGPVVEAFHEEPGAGLAYLGHESTELADSHGPFRSADGTVTAVCHGRLDNHADLRKDLLGRGQCRLHMAGEAELLVHLWHEHGSDVCVRLHGPFGFALWDRRRGLMLARDRVGIVPLYWSIRTPWLLFASEIKALLASGLVRPEADRRGIDHVFTFLGMPAARTCFAGVQALLPGHYLQAAPGQGADGVRVRRYWDLDFPDRGHERNPGNASALADEFQATLLA